MINPQAKWFSNFILLAIVVAGAMVGIMLGYEQMEDNVTCNLIDQIISDIFIAEVVLKICAEGYMGGCEPHCVQDFS